MIEDQSKDVALSTVPPLAKTTGLTKRAKQCLGWGGSAIFLIFVAVASYWSGRWSPEVRYVNALTKKDYKSAIELAERITRWNKKEPGFGEYLSAYALLEMGRLDEALVKSSAAIEKGPYREHALLKAQILYRVGRETQAAAALRDAEQIPPGKWSDNEFPGTAYLCVWACNFKSFNDRLDLAVRDTQCRSVPLIFGEWKCLTSLTPRDTNGDRDMALSLYLFCLSNNDLESAEKLAKEMPSVLQQKVSALKGVVAAANGYELATCNLMCWLPCLSKEKSLNNLANGDLAQLREILSESERLAREGQGLLVPVLVRYESATRSSPAVTDQSLISFSKTNQQLLSEYADSCHQLREWTYSAEVIQRRTKSGELLVEAMIRGYFGDPLGTAKEFQATRDSAYVEFLRIAGLFSDVNRRRANLYKAPNVTLERYFPRPKPEQIGSTTDR